MSYRMHILAIVALLTFAGVTPAEDAATKEPAGKPSKAFVVVFDFETKGRQTGNAQVHKGRPYGEQLADSVRLKLRKQGEQWDVLDRLTTADTSGPLGVDTDPAKVRKLLSDELACDVGLFGTVQNVDGDIRTEVVCIDLREGSETPMWRKVFSDRTERSRAVIATDIVEAVTGKETWQPPEYGDEPEPKLDDFGPSLNSNGTFDAGHDGWDPPDNVSTFIEDGPKGRGKILRVRTDLQREPWLAYRKALRMGKADPADPPTIARDTGYSSVAGLEGVHYRGEWIKATPGQRYWLLADCCPSTAKVNPDSMFFPKVFVKGFQNTPHALDGLPESSLAEMNMTPQDFAALPAEQRKQLVAADAKKHPMRYLRECYRWYLPCRAPHGEWTHFAAPFPPRGGLPDNVEYLQIQIYSYWPPGEYLWDNVLLYADPTQKAPAAEEPARTPGKPKN